MRQDLALNFPLRTALQKKVTPPEFPSSDLIHDIELGISAEVNLNLKIFHSGQRGTVCQSLLIAHLGHRARTMGCDRVALSQADRPCPRSPLL